MINKFRRQNKPPFSLGFRGISLFFVLDFSSCTSIIFKTTFLPFVKMISRLSIPEISWTSFPEVLDMISIIEFLEHDF